MATTEDPSDRFSRRGALEAAIDKIEREFPQFRDPCFQPVAGSAEEQGFAEYKLLKESLHRENLAVIARRFAERVRADREKANTVLARMGLPHVPNVDEVGRGSVIGAVRVSLRQERGKFSEQVIGEVKYLRSEILRSRTEFAFGALRGRYPQLKILDLLSKPPFDDEDRELICHPHQWGHTVTYSTGLLKRHFGLESDETIRKYRKMYKSQFRLTPTPSTKAGRTKRPRRGLSPAPKEAG